MSMSNKINVYVPSELREAMKALEEKQNVARINWSGIAQAAWSAYIAGFRITQDGAWIRLPGNERDVA
jgi:hypothetical protein